MIQAYCDSNSVEIRERPKEDEISMTPDSIENQSKMGSHEITYEMYQQGQSLLEIANERGVTMNTIIGHLIRCNQEEKIVDWSGFIEKEKEEEILRAIESEGLDALKPIKIALPETFTYEDIKIVIQKNELI